MIRIAKPAAVLLAVGLLFAAQAGWTWWLSQPADLPFSSGADLLLTENNGAHAVALEEYQGPSSYNTRMSIAAVRDAADYRVRVCDYTDLFASGTDQWVHQEGYSTRNVAIAANPARKHVAWGRSSHSDPLHLEVMWAETTLTTTADDWVYAALSQSSHYSFQQQVTVETQRDAGTDYVHVVFMDSFFQNNDEKLQVINAYSTDGGASWTRVVVAGPWTLDPGSFVGQPSLAAPDNGDTLHLLFNRDGDIKYSHSHDHGAGWQAVATLYQDCGTDPCIAATSDGFVFACWMEDEDPFEILYRTSTDYGDHWTPDLGQDPDTVWLNDDWEYDAPNVSLVRIVGGAENVVIVCEVARDLPDEVCGAMHLYGQYIGSSWHWAASIWLAPGTPFLLGDELDTLYSPSVAAYTCPRSEGGGGDTASCIAWSTPIPGAHRVVRRVVGRWRFVPDYSHVMPRANPFGSSRNVVLAGDETPHWAGRVWGNVVNGPVGGHTPVPVLVDAGQWPALTLDGDESRWTAYVRDDTVWCMMAEEGYKMVFAGSNAARPGQPSIACYPNQVNGVYVGAVVFPVYDSAGGDESRIMYARVCTSGVVLDTVDSRQDLADSCPCINVYSTDSAYVTYQHGSSVLCRVLEYAASDGSRPPAWGSAQTVTNSGFHPMSVIEAGMLQCVWSKDDGSNHLARKRYADISTTGTWGTTTTVSEEDTMLRANPVYAGVGVSAWQEKVSGKWRIRGRVRGDTVTFVANDTDAYHPHVVACSSAISPSIDQVRAHVLYTAGVVFEVDSAVFDTGQARYVCCSLNVSHAGAMATAENSGNKLLRKPGGDSLFCVYKDFEGSIVYSRSAAGDSWTREVVVQSQGSPAICQDSSGRRWLVTYKPADKRIEARYLNGSSWTGPQTVYTVPEGCELNGGIALAGASGASACAYCAFRIRVSEGGNNYVLVAKFDGSNVARDTVASGTEQSQVTEPTIATEKGTGGDYVHVAWSGSNDIRYLVSDGVIDPADWGEDLTWAWETAVNLSNTEAPSSQPYVACDQDRVVMAWNEAQDIMACQRSTDSAYDNWEDTTRLIAANSDSRYPTVSVGDTVLIAWEEHRQGDQDWDIMASVEYGDTFVVKNTSTKSSYPHVLFQNKASGDTAIPYLHVVWSEEPSQNYYEVCYEKLNLKQQGGGGQQSGGTVELLRPRLYACAPNPFTRQTLIRYQFGQAGAVHLRVYDINGRLVRTFEKGQRSPGVYSQTWNGTDDRGRTVPRGVYFVRLDVPGYGFTQKAVLVR